MTASIYLMKDDLQTILNFMNNFPDNHTVEITSDASSGIGAIINAHLHGVDMNGLKVTITTNIVDETSW